MPSAAGSQESRMPDNPSKASRDRLQNPGARSRTVLQSDVPSQENPGQASGDRLHFPGVHAPGDWSHKVPEWLKLFEEGLSGEPPRLTQCHGGTTCCSAKRERTPDETRASSEEELTDLPVLAERSERPNTSKLTGRHNFF